MLNIRFNVSGLEQSGFVQENLNFSVMQTFELNTKWMTKFCQRLAKTLSRNIWRQFNIKLEFSIQIEDFHLEIPKSISKSIPQDLLSVKKL